MYNFFFLLKLALLHFFLDFAWFSVRQTLMCMFCRSLFVLFLLAIVLSVLLRYTDSDYPFGVHKLFFLFI